jgi:hypothetical protein
MKAELLRLLIEQNKLLQLLLKGMRPEREPSPEPPPEPKLRGHSQPGITMNSIARTVPKPRPPRKPSWG